MDRSAVTKERLRARLLEERREMAFEEVYRLSLRVQKRFLKSAFYRDAARIALYSSFSNEVLTDEIFQQADRDGKEVYYPRVIKKGKSHLAFFRVGHLGELKPGSYEIPEPEEKEVRVGAGTFDLVVVPGVAFDLEGARIGFGKGYYDMALEGLGCPVVALAYEFQVLSDRIPSEAHDVRVSAIITEKRVVATPARPA
jgi:5-formyltetrahydrofolate cyclo-ligase